MLSRRLALMVEILLVVALGVGLFLGLRALAQRQGRKVHERLRAEVTPEMARKAVLALDDEQHKAVYQHIAAGRGREAMVTFKEATGAPLRDCVLAIQALNEYPQPSPSQIRFEQDFDLHRGEDEVDDEYVEDLVDEVRDDADDAPLADEPVAEADPNTGEILGENTENIPDIPGGEKPGADDDVDAKAEELMRASGFDPDAELTIPEEWAAEDEEPAGFHLEVQRGEEKITLSHEDLEPWVHDQLYALLRDDHVDEASQLLADHSPLTREEAHRFLVVFKNQS